MSRYEQAADKDGGHDDRRLARETTIRWRQTDDGRWRASEPASDNELYGRGATPTAAVARYLDLIDDDVCVRVEGVKEAGETVIGDGGEDTLQIPESELFAVYSLLTAATEAYAEGDPNGCAEAAADAKQRILDIHNQYGGAER